MEIEIARGSDRRFACVITDADENPIDITGYTVRIFDAHPKLEDALSLTVTDAAAGEVEVDIQWADTLPHGRLTWFRVQASLGNEDHGSEKIWVTVK